jgi:Mn-dependent DtxR family transcriptional regulator
LTPSHEFIAQMLGVRRAGISEAAAALQKLGVLEYGRKKLRVTDPVGLEKASCECFRLVLSEYDRLLGPAPK